MEAAGAGTHPCIGAEQVDGAGACHPGAVGAGVAGRLVVAANSGDLLQVAGGGAVLHALGARHPAGGAKRVGVGGEVAAGQEPHTQRVRRGVGMAGVRWGGSRVQLGTGAASCCTACSLLPGCKLRPMQARSIPRLSQDQARQRTATQSSPCCRSCRGRWCRRGSTRSPCPGQRRCCMPSLMTSGCTRTGAQTRASAPCRTTDGGRG